MIKQKLRIRGMTCTHCEETVRGALERTGARVLKVSWKEGLALVEGGDPARIQQEVARAGYDVVDVEVLREDPGDASTPAGDAETRPTLLVIGSGSAAFAAAIEARRQGAEVQMITGDRFGGTCVNVGCVPSKFLLHRTAVLHTLQHPPAPFHGCEETVDMGALQKARKALIQTLLQEKYRDVADMWGIRRIPGKARFVSEEEVEVDGTRIRFDRAIIATGARPWIPPIEGLERVGFWTSTEALESPVVPKRLAVIGANAVGLELAQVYARLGSRVVLMEAQPRIAPFEEPEISAFLHEALEAQGIQILTGVRIRCEETSSSGKRVLCQEGYAPVDVDEILVATGRRPSTEGLNLEAAGVETDDRGAIRVDAYLTTTHPRIYAAGDVTPHPQFVYLASRMGQIAARNALGVARETFDPTLSPRVIFTDPEVAAVGLTEARARAQGYGVRSVVMDLEVVARARVEGRGGRVKLVMEEKTGRLLGVHLVMPRAGEVIFAAHLALRAGMTAQDLVDSFAPYLTYAESLRLAAQAADVDVHRLSCCA